MGWQDAPVIDEAPKAGASWQNAPVIDDPADSEDQVMRTARQEYGAAKRVEGEQDQNDRRIERGTPGGTERTPGFRESFMDEVKQASIKNNAFARLYRYSSAIHGIAADEDGAYNKAKREGLFTGTREQWEQQPGHDPRDIYKAKYGAAPESQVDWSKLPANLVKQATENPGAFLGGLVRGMYEDPELLVTPELGLAGKVAKLGKAGTQAARVASLAAKAAPAAEGAAVLGVQSAGVSAAQQLEEHGSIGANKTAQDAVSGAAMGTVLGVVNHAALGAAKDLLARVAAKGGPTTAEIKAKVEAEVADRVAKGDTPIEALRKVWQQYGKAEDADGVAHALEESAQPPQPKGEEEPGTEGAKPETSAEGEASPDDQPRMYRGSGRDDKGSAYNGTEVPIAGEGRYYTTDRATAEKYGPNIEERPMDLENPLRITSDAEWRALTKKAGWDLPNPHGRSHEEVTKMTEALKQSVLDEGHDGIIIDFPHESKFDEVGGKGIKTLRNVFDHSQVVDYRPEVKAEGPKGEPLPPDRAAPEREPTPEERAAERDAVLDRLRQDTEAAKEAPVEPEGRPVQVADSKGEQTRTAIDREVSKGALPAGAGDFYKWLGRQSPQLAGNVKAVFTKLGAFTAGLYHPAIRVIQLARGRDIGATAVHEMLHHTERMMPEKLRNGVRKEWERRVDAIYADPAKYFPSTIPTVIKTGIDAVRVMNQHKGRGAAAQAMYDSLWKLLSQGILPHDFYQYINPSEFWAVNGTRILSGRYKSGLSGAAREWMKDFLEHVKGAAGKESDSPLIEGLRAVMESNGVHLPGVKMLLEEGFHEPQRPLQSRITPVLRPVIKAMGWGTAVAMAPSVAYTLGADRSEAIEAAMAVGALPFAKGLVRIIRKGNVHIMDAMHDRRFDTKDIFRDNLARRAVAHYAVGQWQRSVTAMLKGEPNLPESHIRIRDYVQGHRDVPLSPRELAVADEITQFLSEAGEQGVSSGVLRELREDYLPGLYRKKPFQSWGDVYNALVQHGAFKGNYTGMSPRSKFAMAKMIPDYRTAEALIRAGMLDLEVLTKDPIEMAARYARSLNKTMANKELIDILKKTPGPSYRIKANGQKSSVPLLVGITTRDAANRIRQSNAILADQFDLPEGTKEMANKFAILHAPKDYVAIDHPALEGMRMHRDIVTPMTMMFGDGKPTVIGKAAYASSMAAKSMLFTFSMFHAGSLATNAVILGLRHPVYFAKNLYRAGNALLDVGFRDEVAAAKRAGLVIDHGLEDTDPTFATRMLEYTGDMVERLPGGRALTLPVKGLNFLQQQLNHALWGVIHPTLKLGTHMAMMERWADRAAQGKERVMDKKIAERQIAQGVNDIFGGINWFEMVNNIDTNVARTVATALFSPQGRRWQQTLMLAPDWNIASIRTWIEAAKTAVPGIDARASDHLYRTYLVGSALATIGLSQLLQKHYTGENIWDKEDWSVVDMGDGRRIQLNKHFMEGVHLLSQPQKFILNKAGYLPREAMSQLFGKDYLTWIKGVGVTGPNMADSSAAGRLMHAAKGFVTPIAASNLGNPASLVSSFFGVPIYGKTYDQQADDAGEKARSKAEREGKDATKAEKRARGYVERRARTEDEKRRANQ